MPRDNAHEIDVENMLMTAEGRLRNTKQNKETGQRPAPNVSTATKASCESISPARSSSATRARKSVGPGMPIDSIDELSLKVDFLIKKTKVLENSLHKFKSVSECDGRSSHQWAVHLSELIKMDKHSIADIRDEVNCLKQRIHRLAQRETQDRTEEKSLQGSKVDMGAITEQVFNRVHREFTQIIDDVVRACVLEQMDSFSSASARQVEQGGGYRVLAAQIAELKRKQQLIDEALSVRAGPVPESYCALEAAIQKMDADNRTLAASMSKRFNESMASSREGILERVGEKIAQSMVESRQDLRAEVNACLKAGTKQLQDNIYGLESQLSQRLGTLEDALKPVRDSAFRAESDATHALSLCTDNKLVCNRADDVIQRLGRDMEDLSQRVHGLQQLTSEGEYGRHGASTTPHSYLERDSRRRECASSGGGANMDKNLRTMQDLIRDMKAQLSLQDQKIASLTKILEDHREDYHEVVTRLCSAGRRTKASQKELYDKLVGVADIKQSVEKVLNDIIVSNEEDREALAAMRADTTSAMTEIDTLRASILELTEAVPTLRDVSDTVQNRLVTYHDNEVLPLNEKIAEMEQQLLATADTGRTDSNDYPTNDFEHTDEAAARSRLNGTAIGQRGEHWMGCRPAVTANRSCCSYGRDAGKLFSQSQDASRSLEAERRSEPPFHHIGSAQSREAVVVDNLPESSLPVLGKAQTDSSPGRRPKSSRPAAPLVPLATEIDIVCGPAIDASYALNSLGEPAASGALRSSSRSGSGIDRADVREQFHNRDFRDPEDEVDDCKETPCPNIMTKEDGAEESSAKTPDLMDEKLKLHQKKKRHRQKFQHRLNTT